MSVTLRPDKAIPTPLAAAPRMCTEAFCDNRATWFITVPVETIAEDGSYRRFEARLFMCTSCRDVWESALRADSPTVQAGSGGSHPASGDTAHD